MDISSFSVLTSMLFTCFLISVLYSYREYKLKENKYIVLSVLTITVFLLIDTLEEFYIQNGYGEGAIFNFIGGLRLNFALPVLIYLFASEVLKKQISTQKKMLLMLPFLFFTALNFFLKYPIDILSPDIGIFRWSEYLSLLVFSVFLFYRLRTLIKEEEKNEVIITNYDWLRQVVTSNFFLIFLLIGFNFYKLMFDFRVLWFANGLKIITSLYFFWLCVRGVRELKWKTYRKHETSPQVKTNSKNEQGYLNRIDNLLKADKIYRDPMLSRELFAEKLDISIGYLSELINSHYNQNFSSLINRYRIEEAIELLQDPEFSNYNIISIAYDVGFNSKSVFYNSFKKETGTTPSLYFSKTKVS